MDQNKKSKTLQKSIRLKNETIERIEELAEIENRTFNNMIETLLMRSLQLIKK